MPILTATLCAAAAYRLAPTPLFLPALAVAIVNVAGSCWRLLSARRAQSRARLPTALAHVTAALGVFFLFVSFAVS